MSRARDLADGTFNNDVHITDNTNGPDAALHIEKTTPRLRLQINGNSGYNTIESGGVNELIFGRTGSEQLRILQNGGITFNGDTSTANALNDYEEGTWTPAVTFTGGFTGSLNYLRNTGRYIKVGRLVHIQAWVEWNQNNMTSSTGSLALGGLPYPQYNNDNGRGGFQFGYVSGAWSGLTIYQQCFRMENGTSIAVMNFSNSTNGNISASPTSYTQINSSGGFMVSGTYRTI